MIFLIFILHPPQYYKPTNSSYVVLSVWFCHPVRVELVTTFSYELTLNKVCSYQFVTSGSWFYSALVSYQTLKDTVTWCQYKIKQYLLHKFTIYPNTHIEITETGIK